MSGPAPDALKQLAAEAVAALGERGVTLATAEATTGGLIGHLLTEIPGSSKVFPGGVAPYANSLKRQSGVPASVLEEYGAVSREAAEALATAVREWAGTNVGLAETGIAGPGGAGADRPAGSLWQMGTVCGVSDSYSMGIDLRTGRRALRQRCGCCWRRSGDG